MRLVDLTKPAKLPVTIGEAREQCRITDDTHDTLLMRLIQNVTKQVETRCEMRLISRSMRLDLDAFPSGGDDIHIPIYPVTTITTVAYTDADGDAQTLSEDTGSPEGDYWKEIGNDKMSPILRPLNYWPATKLNKPGAVQITFNAGYESVEDIPEDLRHGILLRVKELFDVSGESVSGVSMEQAINTFDALVHPYRRYRA